MDWTVSFPKLIGWKDTRAISPHVLRGKALRGHSGEKPAIWHPEKESVSEANPAGILILDFPASRSVSNKFLLSEPPSLWYFVTAAQVDYTESMWCPPYMLLNSLSSCLYLSLILSPGTIYLHVYEF